ncbi:MAG: mechanosensitive ion channel [Gammaproteobacteria bacterium]|nr:mechanosensitive ion channel [Gammaproteobacteria bacterium]
MSTRLSLRLLIAIVLAGVLGGARAVPTLEDVAGRLADVEQSYSDDAAKQPLVQTYQQAKAFLEARAANEAAAANFSKSLNQGPATLKDLAAKQAELAARQGRPQLTTAEQQLPATELERLLQAATTELTALENKLKSLELREQALASRPADILQEKSRVARRIGELELETGSASPAETDELGRARRMAGEAELAAKHAELAMLGQEQSSHDVRADVLVATRKLATAQLSAQTARVAELEQLLLARRESDMRDAQENASRAQRDASGAPPVVRKLAGENAAYGEESWRVIGDQARAIAERSAYVERRQRLDDDFARAQHRLKLAGASSSLGRILVEQRRQLPKPDALARQSKIREGIVQQIGLRRIELDESSRQLADGEKSAEALLRQLPADLPPEQRAEYDKQLRQLLKDQVQLIATLDSNYASYLRSIDAEEFELRQLLATVTAFGAYLDERLLWLPNAPPLGVNLVGDLSAVGSWFGRADIPGSLFADFRAGVRVAWFRLLGLVLVVVAVLRSRPRLYAMLDDLAAQVRTPATDRVRYTAYALMISSVLALPLPVLAWAIADLLHVSPEVSDVSLAIAPVLRVMADLSFAFLWTRVFLNRNGVAAVHLHWPEPVVRAFRRGLYRIGPVFIPAYAISSMFDWYGNPAFQYTTRRMLFLLAMGCAAWLSHRLFRRYGPLHHELALKHPSAWLTRSAVIWSTAAVLMPLALAVLAVAGFYYTALELSRYYLMTLLLVWTAALAYGLAQRWLIIAETRLVVERREERAAKREEGEEAAAAESPPTVVDIATVNAQTRLILRNVIGWSVAFGLYWIWKDVLPALTVFQDVRLWEIEVPDGSGGTHAQPITLASLGLATITLGITLIAARNLPGVLEIAILQRLRLHHGSRYAVTTLSQYAIVGLGMSLALGTIGVRWSQIQWLIAALGVGLGFGLQEIFANFVSGLILLFERPIRVGDIVTISDRTGKIARIQIRATTIVDADNKEIIVPNKNFITERFVNWTLTDQVTRVAMKIGIGYRDDARLALELLLAAAGGHPRVLKEPAPTAAVQGFAESAVELELGVHVGEMADRGKVVHDLLLDIQRLFAERGITIPYPQRDLHIHGAKSLPGA